MTRAPDTAPGTPRCSAATGRGAALGAATGETGRIAEPTRRGPRPLTDPGQWQEPEPQPVCAGGPRGWKAAERHRTARRPGGPAAPALPRPPSLLGGVSYPIHTSGRPWRLTGPTGRA